MQVKSLFTEGYTYNTNKDSRAERGRVSDIFHTRAVRIPQSVSCFMETKFPIKQEKSGSLRSSLKRMVYTNLYLKHLPNIDHLIHSGLTPAGNHRYPQIALKNSSAAIRDPASDGWKLSSLYRFTSDCCA